MRSNKYDTLLLTWEIVSKGVFFCPFSILFMKNTKEKELLMKKFCMYCGKELEEGQSCSCQTNQGKEKEENKKSVDIGKVYDVVRKSFGIPNADSIAESFEKNKKIVPDSVVPDDGEIPIRQYHIATLRSIFKGMYAEGRLQVTNKRVLFRAAGISLLGTTELQHEFSIEEISGIEIRRDHRLGVFHFLIAFMLASFFMDLSSSVFSAFSSLTTIFSTICSIVLSGASIGLFFYLEKKFFVKLILSSIAFGSIIATGFTTQLFFIPESDGIIYSVLGTVIGLLLVICMIVVGFVPNLVIEIKTKSASSPIEIRRKESNGILAFLFNMPKKDYTGFADVMPGRDTQKAIKELGAMINDINVLGDVAIENWKEK